MSNTGFDASESESKRTFLAGEQSHSQREMQLLDYLDGGLNAAEAKQVEEHLGACARCRELRRNWQRLDAELSRREPPRLSPNFKPRLWRRISELAPRVLDTEQKRNLEAECRATWNGIRQRFFRSQLLRLLDIAGIGAAALLASYFLHASKVLVNLLDVAGANSPKSALIVSSVAGILILVGSLALVGKRRVAHWVAEL